MRQILGWTAASAFVFLGATSSCTDNEILAELKALGEECFLDSDCNAPLVCVFGSCHVECQTDPDCSDAAATFAVEPRCVVGDKPSNVCLNENEVACAIETNGKKVLSTALCPGELWCGPDGECRNRCASPIDCLAGQVCVQGSCASSEELNDDGLLSDPADSTQGVPCSYHSECVTPLVCRSQVCSEQCLGDVDCPEGYLCVVDDSVEILGPVRVCRRPGGGGALHCGNFVRDDDETDVDCGGSCAPCGTGSPCNAPSDCIDASCDETCLPAACDDTVRNGLETDADCGGPDCAPCPDGATCSSPSDCDAGTTCFDHVCVGPACLNGVLDGTETDVDCGGPGCARCGVGDACVIAGDCTDLVCAGFVCIDGTCSDGIKNNAEAAIDCGGSGCAACPVGASCTIGAQCVSMACDAGGHCAAPSCTDGAQNGLEPGVDCGGPCPSACAAGEGCIDDADCVSGTACDPLTSVCATTVSLTVSVTGSGTGTIVSSPPGIVCPGNCTAAFLPGETITLSATPSPSSTLTGWSACAGTGTCDVVVAAPLSVSANFSSPVVAFAGSSSAIVAASATAYDGQENVYLAGAIGSQTAIGPFTLTQVSGGGGRDAIVVKWSATGTALWAVNFASAATPSAQYFARAAVVDLQGRVVVAVQAPGSFMVGAVPVNCPATAGNKLALVRFNPDGTGATGTCYGSNVAIQDAVLAANGDMLIVGGFTGSSNFGGTTLTSSGADADAFVARYDTGSLALVTAKNLANDGMTNAPDIVRDAAGTSFLIAGDCSIDANFGQGIAISRPAGFEREICAVRLDNQLNPVWAFATGGPDPDHGLAGAFLPNGDVLVGARFVGGVDFGDGGGIHQAGPMADLALLRVNGATGALQPTPSVITYALHGGGLPPAVRDIGVDASGRFHVLGAAYNNTLDLNGGNVTNAFLVTYGSFNTPPIVVIGGSTEPASLRVGPSGQIALCGTGPWGSLLPGGGTPGLYQLLP